MGCELSHVNQRHVISNGCEVNRLTQSLIASSCSGAQTYYRMSQQTQALKPEVKGLTATLDGNFVKNGNMVFRYIVTGSPAAMAAFKEAKGEYWRENAAGQPLHFVTDNPLPNGGASQFERLGARGKLLITPNGNIVVDDLLDMVVRKQEDSATYRQELQRNLAAIDAQAQRAGGRVNRVFGARNITSDPSLGAESIVAANASLEQEPELSAEEREALAAADAKNATA